MNKVSSCGFTFTDLLEGSICMNVRKYQTTIKSFWVFFKYNYASTGLDMVLSRYGSDLHFYVRFLHLSCNQTVGLQLSTGQKLHFGFASSRARLSLNWQLWVLFVFIFVIKDQRMFVAFLR